MLGKFYFFSWIFKNTAKNLLHSDLCKTQPFKIYLKWSNFVLFHSKFRPYFQNFFSLETEEIRKHENKHRRTGRGGDLMQSRLVLFTFKKGEIFERKLFFPPSLPFSLPFSFPCFLASLLPSFLHKGIGLRKIKV